MSEAGVKRGASNEERSGGAKKARGEGSLTLRFLLASRHAGGIIGKGGETIKRLRSEYSAQVYVPDNPGTERVMSIGAEKDNSIGVLKDCLPLMHEPPYPVGYGKDNRENDPDHFEINFLVHQSQVGGIIGSKGARIKQIREETSAGVKVYPDCLPGCNERVVALSGSSDQVVNALENVLDTMVEQPIKGDVILYDPSVSDESYDDGYGGGGGGFNNGGNYNDGGGMGGPMQGGPGGPQGGNFGGSQGGYGGGQGNFGGGNNFNQGGQGGFGGGGGDGGNRGGNFGGGAGGGGGGGSSTQVTIPNDMAGAIIGQGGRRIQEIRQKCGAQIKFADPEPGKKDRLITISGTDEQIQYAQYLMQQCVLNNTNS